MDDMNVHLIDGTYELFRHYYALPKHTNAAGQEVAATRGVVESIVSLLGDGATHVAVATDHVIESFRNDLWPHYKDGSGIEEDLRSQFEPVEAALCTLGVPVWAMVDYEADDALAAGARMAAADHRVARVLICTPDKDLAQCVVGDRIVQFDRRRRVIVDAAGVRAKFGVEPSSIPDYLALVGDAADGYPGLKGWGAKSTATVLARYRHLEDIPLDAAAWDVDVRGASRLAEVLREHRELAFLFRRLATLDVNAPVSGAVDDLAWAGPAADFTSTCHILESPGLARRAGLVASRSV
jgi:5'-3' exonuclease